jgi:hypothetical protein
MSSLCVSVRAGGWTVRGVDIGSCSAEKAALALSIAGEDKMEWRYGKNAQAALFQNNAGSRINMQLLSPPLAPAAASRQSASSLLSTNQVANLHHHPVDHHSRRVTIDVVATINNTTSDYTVCHCCRRLRIAFPAAVRCPRLPPPERCTAAAPSSSNSSPTLRCPLPLRRAQWLSTLAAARSTAVTCRRWTLRARPHPSARSAGAPRHRRLKSSSPTKCAPCIPNLATDRTMTLAYLHHRPLRKTRRAVRPLLTPWTPPCSQTKTALRPPSDDASVQRSVPPGLSICAMGKSRQTRNRNSTICCALCTSVRRLSS